MPTSRSSLAVSSDGSEADDVQFVDSRPDASVGRPAGRSSPPTNGHLDTEKLSSHLSKFFEKKPRAIDMDETKDAAQRTKSHDIGGVLSKTFVATDGRHRGYS